MPNPTRQSAALTALVADLERYPAHSAESQALAAWASERLQAALALAEPRVADAGARHCARCRRDIATELGRQSFMN